MKNLNKLSKTSEYIGKFLFYTIVIILSVASIVMTLTTLGDQSDIILTIAVLAGSFIVIILLFYLLRALFRPIFNLNKNVQLKISNQITEKEFKTKWKLSLICSLIFGILFIIGTLGLSFLLMIPHYILLNKTKGL